jgi:hypothetical protein
MPDGDWLGADRQDEHFAKGLTPRDVHNMLGRRYALLCWLCGAKITGKLQAYMASGFGDLATWLVHINIDGGCTCSPHNNTWVDVSEVLELDGTPVVDDPVAHYGAQVCARALEQAEGGSEPESDDPEREKGLRVGDVVDHEELVRPIVVGSLEWKRMWFEDGLPKSGELKVVYRRG